MTFLVRTAAALAASVLLAGCVGASVELPDRDSPAVRAEEARIAAVLSADTSGTLLSPPLEALPECRVRLLRAVGETRYVFAECTAGRAGVSVPLALVGRTVMAPSDGSEYSPSLRRIFPSDLAEAVLDDPDWYRP